jgi:uncharacterized protein YdhG (YjbR/CyaY superfamily)
MSFASIDEYIASTPVPAQPVLAEMRTRLHRAVPEAQEAISYDMPTLKVDGRNVVHFAGYAKHVAIYPAPEAEGAFAEELASYRAGKGTLRFPLDKPIPYDLIERVGRALADRRS